jgi:hypothetical protein
MTSYAAWLLEERAFPAPEQIRLRPSVPFDDAAVGDRRASGKRARLDVDVPPPLRILSEFGKGGVGKALPDRRDERDGASYRHLGGLFARPD